MRIRTEPGVVVRLDRNRTTSTKGGEYELPEKMPESQRKRILATRGVTEIKAAAAAKKEA